MLFKNLFVGIGELTTQIRTVKKYPGEPWNPDNQAQSLKLAQPLALVFFFFLDNMETDERLVLLPNMEIGDSPLVSGRQTSEPHISKGWDLASPLSFGMGSSYKKTGNNPALTQTTPQIHVLWVSCKQFSSSNWIKEILDC